MYSVYCILENNGNVEKAHREWKNMTKQQKDELSKTLDSYNESRKEGESLEKLIEDKLKLIEHTVCINCIILLLVLKQMVSYCT